MSVIAPAPSRDGAGFAHGLARDRERWMMRGDGMVARDAADVADARASLGDRLANRVAALGGL